MNIVDKILMILGKKENDMINNIKNNPEKYYLRLESLSFIMVIRKEDNKYINIYDTVDNLQQLINVLEKHPTLEV